MWPRIELISDLQQGTHLNALLDLYRKGTYLQCAFDKDECQHNDELAFLVSSDNLVSWNPQFDAYHA